MTLPIAQLMSTVMHLQNCLRRADSSLLASPDIYHIGRSTLCGVHSVSAAEDDDPSATPSGTACLTWTPRLSDCSALAAFPLSHVDRDGVAAPRRVTSSLRHLQELGARLGYRRRPSRRLPRLARTSFTSRAHQSVCWSAAPTRVLPMAKWCA